MNDHLNLGLKHFVLYEKTTYHHVFEIAILKEDCKNGAHNKNLPTIITHKGKTFSLWAILPIVRAYAI